MLDSRFIWDKAYIQHADNKYYEHKLLRRNKMNNPELEKYREKQHNSSIDTLTNQLKQMEADITNMETTINKKYDERGITKDVLRLKLEDTLKGLHFEDSPLQMSSTMLSAQDLNNLGIDSHTDEPVVKMSHENT
jgi:TolA-binding protein